MSQPQRTCSSSVSYWPVDAADLLDFAALWRAGSALPFDRELQRHFAVSDGAGRERNREDARLLTGADAIGSGRPDDLSSRKTDDHARAGGQHPPREADRDRLTRSPAPE